MTKMTVPCISTTNYWKNLEIMGGVLNIYSGGRCKYYIRGVYVFGSLNSTFKLLTFKLSRVLISNLSVITIISNLSVINKITISNLSVITIISNLSVITIISNLSVISKITISILSVITIISNLSVISIWSLIYQLSVKLRSIIYQ